MERSNAPVTTGTMAASASTAGIDWVDRIESTVSRVGKVSGRAREKTSQSRAVRTSRP